MPVAAPPAVTATVDRDVLLSLLHSCAKAAAGKRGAHGMPILRAARVTFGDGQIAMRATDLDLTVDCTDAVSEKVTAWSFVCDHARLLEITRAMPEGDLQLSGGEGKVLTVTSGLAAMTIPLEYEPDNYPSDPELGDLVCAFDIAAADLVWLLRQVAFAAGEGGAFVLDGAIVTRNGSVIEAAATNGHRLSIASANLVSRTGKQAIFVIPRFAIEVIVAREWEDDATLSVAVHENHTVIRSGGYSVTARRDSVNTPNYRNSIPKNTVTAILDRVALLSALKRVALAAGERSKCVVLEFESGRLTVSSQSERGKGDERLPADYSGEKLRIGFDYRYLLDYLPTVESTLIELQMGDDVPVLIRPTEMPDSERELLYVVVPMRMT